MKKRLRKKFRLGEFTEFEFQVDFKMKETPDASAVDALLGTFLDDIEARGLVGGGTFSNQGDFTFSLYANRAKVAVTEEHRQAVEAWLVANPAIASHTVGPLVDAWHPAV
jgi:uncharacterized protein YggL (DUF469 family)